MMQRIVATPSFRLGASADREIVYTCGCMAFNLTGRGFPPANSVDVTCPAHCAYTCASCNNPCAVVYLNRYCLPCAERIVPERIN